MISEARLKGFLAV